MITAPSLTDVLDAIGPLDEAAMARTAARLDRLTKPPGSLGRLEELAIAIAGITGRDDARVDRRAIVIAAADHGVARRGVSAYPPEVTAQMVANFVDGGAAINVLARAVGASVTILDVGVASPIPSPTSRMGEAAGPADDGRTGLRFIEARIRDGTADMTVEPAMTRADVERAIGAGLAVGTDLVGERVECVGIGEMGIGNTTAASALVAAFTGIPVDRVTGRGTGVDEAGRANKVALIESALARHAPDPADPIGVLAAVGGLEIAALVGVMAAAAAGRVPVVLDGFITGAAALVAAALRPAIAPRLVAAHRSVEPGHAVVLDRLGLRPLLDLDLRLGEGTGAALAMPILGAAVAIRDGMATFESAGVDGRVDP